MKIKLYFLFLLVFGVSAAQLPKEFVYVKDVVPSIKVELRYFSNNNFLGVAVDSYKKDVAILTIAMQDEIERKLDKESKKK